MTPRAPLLAAAALLSAASITIATTTDGAIASVTTTGAQGESAVAVPHSIDVALAPRGCAPASARVPGGPVTVNVSNADAPGASELGLLSDGRQLAEVEGVAPGLTGNFTITLAPGSYQLTCQVPLGKSGVKTELTVTPPVFRTLTAAGRETHALLRTASADYDDFVREETRQLIDTTKTFDDAVRAGKVAEAKDDYAAARVHYERIEPVAESFGMLDALIDERIDDVLPGQSWTGFHQIEHSLYVRGVLTGEKPIATELDLTLANLRVLVDREVDQPAQLADGAASLLNEVGATKITGEEERYSHIDAVDLVANVFGATTAIRDLMPALRRIDPVLAGTVTRRFADLQAVLDSIPAGVTRDWRTATPALKARLSNAVDAAAAPLAKVAAEVAAGLTAEVAAA